MAVGGHRRPSDALAAHRDEVLRMLAEVGMTDVRLFGSVARGEDTDESDLDLLVAYPSGLSLFDLVSVEQRLEDLLGCRVQILGENALGKQWFGDRIARDLRPL